MAPRDPLDEATVQLQREYVLRAAREADSRARAAEAEVAPSTQRSGPPETEVAVETLMDDLDVDALLAGTADAGEGPTLTLVTDLNLPTDPTPITLPLRTDEHGRPRRG